MQQLIKILSIKNNNSLKFHLLISLIVKEINQIAIRCQVHIFHVKVIFMDNKVQKIYYFNKVLKKIIFLINYCNMHIKICMIIIQIVIRNIIIINTKKILMNKTIFK